MSADPFYPDKEPNRIRTWSTRWSGVVVVVIDTVWFGLVWDMFLKKEELELQPLCACQMVGMVADVGDGTGGSHSTHIPLVRSSPSPDGKSSTTLARVAEDEAIAADQVSRRRHGPSWMRWRRKGGRRSYHDGLDAVQRSGGPAVEAAELTRMYKELGAKAWESTVRRTQAAARKRGAAIFSSMSVAHADDDDGAVAAREAYHAEKLLPNGDFYTGEWAGEVPQGVGKYLWTDGCMYEGEWAKGKTTGKGKFSWPSGATYEGEFKSGYMDGYGTYTSSSGDTYRGQWVMNLKQGQGRKSYYNGDHYEGEWRGGVQDGHGKYVWKNGNEYEGGWRCGAISGKGSLLWANGNRYVGCWEDGLPKGDGRFLFPNGSFYVGVWSKDPKEQNGTYYTSGAASPAGNPSWNPQQVYNVDLSDCQICPGEKVSILPSQKTLSWNKAWRSRTPPRKSAGGWGRPSVGGDEGADLGYDHGCAERDDDPCTARPFNPRALPRERKRQGETISKGHKNYELMLNLQLGIR